MNKMYRYPVALLLAASVTLPVISSARADQAAECAAARRRAASIPALWSEGNRCDLDDDDKIAVKPDPQGAALGHFRDIKSEWLTDFDKTNPYAVAYELDEIRTMANDFISHHPERAELGAKLRNVVSKIDGLNQAVDRMRPNGGTTPAAVTAIDRALGDLQFTCTQDRDGNYPYCPAEGTSALDVLDHALQTDPGLSADASLAQLKTKVHGVSLGETAQGLDRIRNILTCRLNDEQLIRDRATVRSAACGTVASSAPAAQPAPGAAAAAVAQGASPAPAALPPAAAVADQSHPAPAPASTAPYSPPPVPQAGSATVRASDELDGGVVADPVAGVH